MNITIELLKSITPEKMVELEFWKLNESDFRKLNAALEKKQDIEARKQRKKDWYPIGDLGKEIGISEETFCQRNYHFSKGDLSESLYYLANDSCDAIIVRSEKGKMSVELKKGYWAPDYHSILAGRHIIMQQTIIDIERAVKYGVPTNTAVIFGDVIEEFILEMTAMSQKRRDGFFEIIRAGKIMNPLIFFNHPSEKLKTYAKNAGFFAVAYAVLTYQPSSDKK